MARHKLKDTFLGAASPADYIREVTRSMAAMLAAIDAVAVERVIDVVAEAGANGRSIFLVANGGSAAVASHFVNDLGVNSWVPGERGFRVFCLADNTASLTAVANDVSYDAVFSRQLECNLVPGDVVIAMSVSGNSENIVRAIEVSNREGATTVALCGFDGGRLAGIAHHVVHVPSSKDEYGPVEDIFSVIAHVISGYLTMRRGRFLHH